MATITKFDKEQGYLTETLKEVLESGHSCRHAARIAHLYISNTPHLTNEDYTIYLQKLLDCIFGLIDEDYDSSWLTSRSGVPTAPPSLLAAIASNLEATFVQKTALDKELASAFRVAHLLSPLEKGTLYDFIFHRPHSQCVYYFRAKYLPSQTKNMFHQWLNAKASGGQSGFGSSELVPQSLLLSSLSMIKGEFSRFQVFDGVALDLKEYFLFRFFNWFATNRPARGTATSKKTSTVPARSSSSLSSSSTKPVAPENLHRMSVPAMVNGSIANELLLHYTRDFLPHPGMPNPQLYTLCDTPEFARNQWMFIQCIIEFWLQRHRTSAAVKPVSVVPTAQQSGSGMANGLPNSSQFASNVNPPTNTKNVTREIPTRVSYGVQIPPPKTLQAILIVICHLHTDPIVASSPADSTAQHLTSVTTALSAGTSPILQLLKPHLFEFFNVNLSNLPAGYTDFIAVADIWLRYLQPWTAAAWMTDPSITSTKKPDLREAKPSRYMKNVVRALVSTSVSTERSNQGSSNSTREPSKHFSIDWIWYVVQNYLVYAQVLSQVLLKIADAQQSSLCELVNRMFSPDGPFNDGVIAVLRACEIFIQDSDSGSRRALVTTVGDKWMFSNETNHTASRVPGPGTENRGTTIKPETVLAILEALDKERELVTLMLNNQFASLNWNLEKQPLPWLLNMRPGAERVLQGLYRFVETNSNTTGVSRNKSTTSSDRNRISQTSTTWHSFQARSSTATKTPVNYSTHFKNSMDRFHLLFGIPVETKTNSSHGTGLSNAQVNSIKFPETETIVATPGWLGKPVECVYRRLTARGRLQLETGERINPNHEFGYVGDALTCPPPVCSYEIFTAVRALHWLSVSLNNLLGLETRYVKDSQPNGATVYRPGFRINLRFLADVRVLLWILLFADLLDIIVLRAGFAVWSIPMMASLCASFAFEGTALWVVIGVSFGLTLVMEHLLPTVDRL